MGKIFLRLMNLMSHIIIFCLLFLYYNNAVAYVFRYTDSAGRAYYTDYSDESELPTTIQGCESLREELIRRNLNLELDQVKVKAKFDKTLYNQQTSSEKLVDPEVMHLNFKASLLAKEEAMMELNKLIREAVFNKELLKKVNENQIKIMRGNKQK